jgi:hypothetical protein
MTGALSGDLAAGILERRPSEFRAIALRIAKWLAGWNASTKAVSGEDALARTLAGYASALRPHLGDSTAYFAFLNDRIRAGSAKIPQVATHGDLTMWNVVVGGAGLGILDWEEARTDGIPLTDLFYALVDATAACESYRQRPAAFESCLSGARRDAIGPLVKQAAEDLGMDRDATETCFHLCWLGHAANEVTRKGPGGAFLEIVRNLARTGRSW